MARLIITPKEPGLSAFLVLSDERCLSEVLAMVHTVKEGCVLCLLDSRPPASGRNDWLYTVTGKETL